MWVSLARITITITLIIRITPLAMIPSLSAVTTIRKTELTGIARVP
jgi:hypothetical protein